MSLAKVLELPARSLPDRADLLPISCPNLIGIKQFGRQYFLRFAAHAMLRVREGG